MLNHRYKDIYRLYRRCVIFVFSMVEFVGYSLKTLEELYLN